MNQRKPALPEVDMDFTRAQGIGRTAVSQAQKRLTQLVAVAALSALTSCGGKQAMREQLVVVIDTDAPVIGHLFERQALSADAAMDSLRVDLLDELGQAYESRLLGVSQPSAWPVSFGAVPGADAGPLRARLRLFRSSFALRATELEQTTLEPLPQVAIDRLVSFDFKEGVTRQRVTLAMDCLGIPADLAAAGRTCIDGARVDVDVNEGVEIEAATPASSLVGSWPDAYEIPCPAPGTEARICIPGGFAVLGDVNAVGAELIKGAEPVPLRPFVLQPFYVDRTEFTVGRLRSLLGSSPDPTLEPHERSADERNYNHFCSWLGRDQSRSDALPVNCIAWKVARQVCQLEGGDLLTEAQWEFAARGRGESRDYPWGASEPTCQQLSASRAGPDARLAACNGEGPAPAGEHSTGEAGTGDTSRDGVVDLAGNVLEALRDSFEPLDSECWSSSNILRDPLCQTPNAAWSARGGSWSDELARAYLPLRNSYQNSTNAGFRCGYEAPP